MAQTLTIDAIVNAREVKTTETGDLWQAHYGVGERVSVPDGTNPGEADETSYASGTLAAATPAST